MVQMMRCRLDKRVLAFILLFSFLHITLYALLTPPWGLLDEEHHFDYVLKLTQTGRAPITGQDRLDPQVVQSIYDTQRHYRFHLPTPKLNGPDPIALEGYSYEGYQGPAAYLLMAPFYWLLQNLGILSQLYGLRILLALASLITIACAMQITAELFPEQANLPYWVGFLLACLPERASYSSHLSNDILLEVLSVLFIWIFTRAALREVSWKTALGLGLVGGLGFLTKISFAGLFVLYPLIYILKGRQKGIFIKASLSAAVLLLLIVPFVLYNLRTYGDLTGFQGFAELYTRYNPLWAPPLTLLSGLLALWGLFTTFWVVWWKGAEAITRPYLTVIWMILFGAASYASVGLVRKIKQLWQANRPVFLVLVSYLILILVFAVLTLTGYFSGKFPVLQGRFVNPVVFPAVLLFCLGLQQMRSARYAFGFICALLLGVDLLNLFGNLMRYFYFYASFFLNGEPTGRVWQGWWMELQLFMTNFSSDKPAWVIVLGCAVLVAYAAGLIWLLIRSIKSFRLPHSPVRSGEWAR